MRKLFIFFTLIFTALLATFTAYAGVFDSEPVFLPADQAFQFSVQAKNQQIELHWAIADGYCLYKQEITTTVENGKIGKLQFPQGELHQDEFMGETEMFCNDLTVLLPILEITDNSKLTVTYQGCTKGLCYPPEEKVIDLKAYSDLKTAVQKSPVFNHTSGSVSSVVGKTQLLIIWKIFFNKISIY